MNFRSDATDKLFESILKLESIEECYAYFEDLCTVKEIQDMSQRLEAAMLLDSGDSYLKIVEKTGLSTATIGRVSKCLNYGAGGYRMAIDRMGGKNDLKKNGEDEEDK